MGLPEKLGTQIELTFITDEGTFNDSFTLCGIWDGDAVAYRQTIFLSKEYTQETFLPFMEILTVARLQ